MVNFAAQGAANIDSIALWVAIGAGLVALGALGVSVWQAWTAHAERTGSTPARWVLEYPRLVHAQPELRWRIHNTGGSSAFDVMLLMVWKHPEAPDTYLSHGYRVNGPIARGAHGELAGTGDFVRPGPLRSQRVPAKSLGVWEWRTADAPATLDLRSDRTARVMWRDSRGRQQNAPINLWTEDEEKQAAALLERHRASAEVESQAQVPGSGIGA